MNAIFAVIFLLFGLIPLRGQSEFVNHIGMVFVKIPAGELILPVYDTLRGLTNDGSLLIADTMRFPISNALFIGKYEVTMGEYFRFLKESPDAHYSNEELAKMQDSLAEQYRKFQKYFSSKAQAVGMSDRFPAANLSWFEACAFLRWLNATKPASDSGTYRLPTEAEWEYCIRAGKTGAMSDNEHARKNHTFYNFGEVLRPVDEFAPNAWGICGMKANVWEYCLDSFESPRSSSAESPETLGTITGVILRGDVYDDFPYYTMPSVRSKTQPDNASYHFGFRVVRIAVR